MNNKLEKRQFISPGDEHDSDYGNLLARYSKHQLTDLDNASLMSRIDTKYIVSADQVKILLRELCSEYTALENNGQDLFDYFSLYFDTDQFDLYHMHHNARKNRYKVRMRSYLDSGASFLEVKHKSNKGRTNKSRIPIDSICSELTADQISFIHEQGFRNAECLRPTQISSYQRIALANEELGERVTIDTRLTFKSRYLTQKEVSLGDMCIVEVKQHRRDLTSPCHRVLKSQLLRPISFSKYCIGMGLTNTEFLKVNKFKHCLRKVS